MSEASSKVVTRFAPSPTGALHVGGARTALFNWAYARHFGGQFIIRIEDTDQARSTPQSTRGILEDLKWLGINWDQGPDGSAEDPYVSQIGDRAPYFQSQRLDTYRKYCDQLLASGRAYECFKTPAELTAARDAAKAEKRDYRYDGSDMIAATKEQKNAWKAEGKPFVIRFRTSGQDVVVSDQVLGDVVVKADQLEDFVIFKGDGFPTYHFAVVVDDALMGVTHVIRAQEHLSNTPKHVALQEALGFDRPQYAHLPLIFNADGSKMSKRDKAKVARAAVKAQMKSNEDKERIVADCLKIIAHRRDIPEQLLPVLPGSVQIVHDERVRMSVTYGQTLNSENDSFLAAFRGQLNEFLDKKNDNLVLTRLLAEVLDVALPEIDIADFRRSGYLPHVILNYISLLGWNPGGNVTERFELSFLVEKFSFEGVGKSNSKFDRDKLKAFNGDALRALPIKEFTAKLRAFGEEYHPQAIAKLGGHFAAFAAAYHERSATLNDPFVIGRFFFSDDAIKYDPKSVEKILLKDNGAGLAVLKSVQRVLMCVDPWEPATIHKAIEDYASTSGLGMGSIAQPLRVAITGTTVSPAIQDTLAILGQSETVARIASCIIILEN